jgi:tetratricopeptide (TPR) repeat protein
MGERLAKSENWREPPGHRFAVQWGLLYQQKKDFRRAELMFRRAVALRPSATNLTHLAEVLVIEGQFIEASRHLQRAIRQSALLAGPQNHRPGMGWRLATSKRGEVSRTPSLSRLLMVSHSPSGVAVCVDSKPGPVPIQTTNQFIRKADQTWE